MKLTLKQLKIFEAVAKYQSYSRAASSLFLTQPAVSMQIKQLETRFGMPLFERRGKQTKMTAAGTELLFYSESIQQQINEAETVLKELKGLQRGRLHLTMASTANYFAPQLIAGFRRKHPKIAITLEVTNRSGLVDAVEHNRTDMAIMGKPPKHHHLVGEDFMDNPLVIIASPSHPLANKKNIALSDVADAPFIVRESDSGTRMAAERFFAEHDLSLTLGMEMNRSEAIKQAVMAELGLGIVSLHTIEMELLLKRLTILDVEDFPIMRQWHVVYREDKRFSVTAKAFKTFVLEHAKNLVCLAVK